MCCIYKFTACVRRIVYGGHMCIHHFTYAYGAYGDIDVMSPYAHSV